MNAKRNKPAVRGAVLVANTSPEGGEEHQVWLDRALETASKMGFEKRFLKYKI